MKNIKNIKNIASLNDLPEAMTIYSGFFESDLAKYQHYLLCDSDNELFLFIKKSLPVKIICNIVEERLLEQDLAKLKEVYACDDSFFNLIKEHAENNQQINDENESDRLSLSKAEIKIRELLVNAIQAGASDIHIVRHTNKTNIYYRQLGSIVPLKEISPKECDMMMSVLYNVNASGKGVAWNRREPQDAIIPLELLGVSYSFRYAHMPIHSFDNESYHTVLRVLTGNQKYTQAPTEDQRLKAISGLGFNESQIKALIKMFSSPHGLIIVAGTTGSGKSTTIKCMLEWLYHEFHDGQISMLSVEDPVEYAISGAIQTSIVRGLKDQDNAFMPGIYSAMRRDPDVLLVGETRDPHTASALVDIVEGGHIAVSSVHASSAIGVVQRLDSLGVDYKKQSGVDFWSGIICQKLVKTLCRVCCHELKKTSSSPRESELLERIQLSKELKSFGHSRIRVTSHEGCEECDFRGSSGRKVVAEMLLPDVNILQAISENNSLEMHKSWLSSNKETAGVGEPMRITALKLVAAGELCPIEFESKFGLI